MYEVVRFYDYIARRTVQWSVWRAPKAKRVRRFIVHEVEPFRPKQQRARDGLR